MLRALKTKLANFIRAQVAIVTEPQIEAVLAEQRILQAQIAALSSLCASLIEQTGLSRHSATVVDQLAQLPALVERNLRATENERGDMDETQRMIGIASPVSKISSKYRRNAVPQWNNPSPRCLKIVSESTEAA